MTTTSDPTAEISSRDTRRRRSGLVPIIVLVLTVVVAPYALASAPASQRADAAAALPPPPGPVLPVPVPAPITTATVSASSTTVLVGASFTLSVLTQFGNLPSPSETVVINGLASGLTLQSAVSDRGACTQAQGGGQIQCSLGAAGPGNVIGVTIVAVASAPGSYQFTANASPFGSSSAPVNVNVIAPDADLSVQVPSVTLRPTLGRRFRTGVVVANAGPVAATAAVLTLSIPPELELLSATSQSGGCGGAPLTCQLGSLSAGARTLVVLSLRVVKAGRGRLLAALSGQPTDPVPANNSGSLPISVARASNAPVAAAHHT